MHNAHACAHAAYLPTQWNEPTTRHLITAEVRTMKPTEVGHNDVDMT